MPECLKCNTSTLASCWGGRGPVYSFRGIPGGLSSPSWNSQGILGRARLSLGTLRVTISSFGSRLTSRRDTFQSVGSSTVGHSQGATIPSFWHPRGLLLGSLERYATLLGTSSALLERPRYNFHWLLTYFAFGPVSVQGRERDVRAICTRRRILCKVR